MSDRINYAWVVLAGLFLLYMATNGIMLNTLPLMYPELTKEFGWNEAEVTRPAALFLLLTAILTPFMGALCDKFSPRLIILLGVVLIVGPLAFYPQISSLGQMTTIYLICAVGLACCGLVANMLVLSRWFTQRRGLAIGIFLMASSLGGAVFPLLARETLSTQGWQQAIMLITAIGAGMMALGLLLIRDRPPAPKTVAEGDGSDAPALPATTGVATLRAAVKMPAFYLLMVATGAVWFAIVAILQHQSIYLGQDLGVSTEQLPLIFSVFFWCAIIGKVLFGYLGDRFNKVWILVLSIANLIAGLVVLRLADPNQMITLYGYAVVYGVGFAGAFSAIQLVLAEFFAGPSYGRILGVFTMVDSLAGAVGIQFLGARRVADESYVPGLELMIGLLVAVMLMTIVLRRYQPEPQPMPAH
ncbi:MAG: MFS transporter [Pseudomonadota bacterium]